VLGIVAVEPAREISRSRRLAGMRIGIHDEIVTPDRPLLMASAPRRPALLPPCLEPLAMHVLVILVFVLGRTPTFALLQEKRENVLF
jgi:hypothetical protein